MKIAFFTEGHWYGKVPENHPNMRTDLAWIHLLDADHYCLYTDLPTTKYDIGIIIIPKNRVDIPLESIKKICTKVAIMQEGPHDLWTDYTLGDQLSYLNLHSNVDFLLCHNKYDKDYYYGLFNKPTYVMPPAMVDSVLDKTIVRKKFEDRKYAIIGGNMCTWYNGMVSFIMAQEYSNPVYVPSMGRKIPGEERIQGLRHLPYMQWSEWIKKLNDFSIGIHLMPTVAAGTFSLNCAYLGIPCIGNQLVDSQNNCFTYLSYNVADITNIKKQLNSLKHDVSTYKFYSDEAIDMYYKVYSSKIFVKNMTEIFETILS